MQQHLDGRLYSWGEGARQALGQNADAVGRGVAIAHVVSAGADGATHPRSPQARLLRSRYAHRDRMKVILYTDA